MNYGRKLQSFIICGIVAACFGGPRCEGEDLRSIWSEVAAESAEQTWDCDDYGNACNCAGSQWTARVGALFMKRESPASVPMLIENFGAGPTVLQGSDFDFDFQPGVEASLIYDSAQLPAPIEARYFWLSDWTDSISLTGLTNARVNTTPQNGSYSTLDFANYKSQLQSFELHFRKQVFCDLTVLAGIRYIKFDEDLNMLLDGFDQYWWGIQNDLFGFQVGAEQVLYDNCCNFKIEAIAKLGIYGNDACVASQVALVEQPPTSERGGMDHAAFLGELGLLATYDLSCCWSIRAGYQVMWLDGVLVAANQVSATDNNAMTLNFDYTDVFFHGAMVQVERRW